MTTNASLARAFSCEPAATPDEIAAISAVLQLANFGGHDGAGGQDVSAGGRDTGAGERTGASRWRLAARREAVGRAEIAGGARA
jgi:hypothetical protein